MNNLSDILQELKKERSKSIMRTSKLNDQIKAIESMMSQVNKLQANEKTLKAQLKKELSR